LLHQYYLSFQAAPNLYIFHLGNIFISFVDTEELLKKFYVSSVKYFIHERSLAQKNIFTFYLFSSFVNNELESIFTSGIYPSLWDCLLLGKETSTPDSCHQEEKYLNSSILELHRQKKLMELYLWTVPRILS